MNAGAGDPGPPRSWEEIANHLFQLLDDIDTASDLYKPEQTAFYRHVMGKANRRFEVASSDGFSVTFNVTQ